MKNIENAAFLFFCQNRLIDGDHVVVNDFSSPVPIKPEWYSYRDEILASDGKYIARLKGCRHGHVGFAYANNKTCVLCYRVDPEKRREKAEKRREIAAAKREEEQKLREASAEAKREAKQKRLQAAREASIAKRREARVTAMFDKAAALREESDKVYLEAMALAAKPLDEEIEGLSPRQAAISRGERWYMPDTPCPKCGQMAERYVATGACRGCK
ncbi:MAG: DUF723 domain-containing protein [Edwardsiella phage MSW-3]|uniref:Uncharacterized protein n=1 Tax=Edwardsiella phage MSW-3 TaxID=1264700 RepID=L0MY11_9CAUD|nr:hypothetical protein G428_gp66 [Edwardsiella phage MSW-3]BAM68887.1 hypothetical protein [Edwardsiella phage MSW-3]BEU28792.1 MAG: DUF723 domain-containing protein [Edwardsiella phage MSW-3]